MLGIVRIEEGPGRLVVVELKPDGSSTTVDLQAIKYAAYVAACQFGDVVAMYAAYHDVDDEAATGVLLDLLGGTEDELPVIDDTPRIVVRTGLSSGRCAARSCRWSLPPVCGHGPSPDRSFRPARSVRLRRAAVRGEAVL